MSSGKVDLRRLVAVEVPVELQRALAPDQRPVLPALGPGVQEGHLARQIHSRSATRQQVTLGWVLACHHPDVDRVEHELDGRQIVVEVDGLAGHLKQLGRFWRDDLCHDDAHGLRLPDHVDVLVLALHCVGIDVVTT